MPGALPPQADRRAQREDHAVGGVAGRLGGVLVHAPDVAEELHVDAGGLAGLQHRDVGGRGVAEIGVVGAGALQAQALRAVVAGRQREHQRRQHFEAEFGGERFAGRLRRVRIGMVGAHMDEFRLARLALGLPVLGRPGQHRRAARRNSSGRRRNCTARAWPCRWCLPDRSAPRRRSRRYPGSCPAPGSRSALRCRRCPSP